MIHVQESSSKMKVQQGLHKHHNFKGSNNSHVYLSQLGTVPRVSKLLYTKGGSRNPRGKKINFIYNSLRNIKHQTTNMYYNFQTFQRKLKKVLLLYLLVGVSEYSDLNLQLKQDTPNCDVISAGTWNQNIKMINCSPNKTSS